MVDAAGGFIAEKNVAMFERTKVFTAAECRSRYEITLETYAKHIHIDASTMLEMAGRSLLPASYEYLSRVSRAEYYAERNGCACASTSACSPSYAGVTVTPAARKKSCISADNALSSSAKRMCPAMGVPPLYLSLVYPFPVFSIA